MTVKPETSSCTLCELPISHPIIQDEHAFCCGGCQAVFNVLKMQNQLADWKEHPLFRQALKSGLISNPDLAAQINQKESPEQKWEKYYLEVSNMWCASCGKVIEWILLREKGIRKCTVDYATDLMVVEFSPLSISKEKIISLLVSFGYQAHTLENRSADTLYTDLYKRFGIAAFFSINIMMFSYPIYASYFNQEDQGWGRLFSWLSFFASLPVIFYSGWPILRRFWTSIKVQIFGMETLVMIGITTAFALSLYELFQGTSYVYFDSLTAIITFVLLGKMIDAKAKATAKESIIRLIKSVPKRARKKQAEGVYEFVSIKEVKIGDEIRILTGEKIVLDGVVVEGEAACDESVMTGEPILIRKKVGDSVLAGSLLQQGTCSVRVTATLEQTVFHQIIDSVQEDMQHKSRSVRAIERVLKWFIPFVIIFSLGSASLFYFVQGPFLQEALLRFISILLISCPCAIGIAAPLAESYLIQGLAKLGILVRNRGCLRFLGNETVFVFDKTGTVTEGKFKVLKGLSHLSEEQKLILKSLAANSTHPISYAISHSILTHQISLENINEYPGKGIQGEFQGKNYRLGSRQFLQEALFDPNEEGSDEEYTTAFFSEGGKCIAKISLGDTLKGQIVEVIQSLYPLKTVLLSGDNAKAVSSAALQCGFTDFKSEVTPLEKKAFIAALKEMGGTIAMIGDGINDAPALVNAHIGISVANAVDVSMQASDVLLMSDNLLVIPKMRILAKKGQRILKQNLFWAFFYNVIGMFLAAFGWLTPIFSAFAMTVSSIIVLLNARRLEK